MTQSTTLETIVDEYADWLKSHSSVRSLGNWNEVTVPFLDHMGDHFQFYVRFKDGRVEFNDDGYTLSNMETSGFSLQGKRKERVAETANQFGALYKDGVGSIAMIAKPEKTGDAMNRYVQALVHVDSLMEIVNRRVAGYFAKDVADALSEQNIYYTQDVNIQGKSLYSHNFDFLFQKSKNRPTIFAKAPNRLDQTALAMTLFAWDDVSGTKERKDAELLVFADDRDRAVNADVLTGFERYNAKVLKYSEIPDKARPLLAARVDGLY